MMRSRMLGGAAALALTSAAVLATAGPASAQDWRHRSFDRGLAGFAAGVVGGAVAAATAPLWAPGYYGYYDYYPGYAYAPGYTYDTYSYDPGYAYSPGYTYNQGYTNQGYTNQGYLNQGYTTGGRDDAYCTQRYRSYDPASGTYLGYDGIRHPCP